MADTGSAKANRPPNIVLVLTDDLEPSLLRFMPQVRAMQTRGANFTNYTVSDSLCCPSRASILTGQYPHTSKIYTNTEPDGGYGKFNGSVWSSRPLACFCSVPATGPASWAST